MRHRYRRQLERCSQLVVMPLLLIGTSAQSANIGIGSSTRVNLPLQSMKELRDKDLVKQRFDYSCGAAGMMTAGQGGLKS